MTGRGLALALAVLVGLAGPGLGADLPVRSGEHPGFSRIVVEGLPAGSTWRMERDGTRYAFSVDGTASFDTSAVFDRIPRARLRDLAQSGGRLMLTVDAGAHAVAVEVGTGRVAIDIRDGPPPPGSPFEVQVTTPAAGPLPHPQSRPAAGAAGAAGAATLAFRDDEATPGTVAAFWNGPFRAALTADAEAGDTPAGDAAPELTPVAPELAPDLPMPFDEDLVRQIGRAASQGLVEIDGDALPEEPAPALSDSPVLAGNPTRHLAASTAFDLALSGGGGTADRTEAGVACPEPEVFDVRAWGTGDPFPIQLAAARQDLLGEFDRVDPPAALRLVRTLVFFGLGAEAVQAADELAPGGEAVSAAAAIAAVLDEQGQPDLAVLTACDGPVALWAFLTRPDVRTADHGAVLRAFSGLPPHLRSLLGRRLANRFIAAGALDAASAVRESMARGEGDAVRPLAMIDAALDEGAGNDVRAAEDLETLATGDDDLAAEALVLSIRSRIARNQQVTAEQVEELGVLAFEMRKTEAADSFTALHIQARASAGDFRGAIADWRAWSKHGDPDAGRDTRDYLVSQLLHAADDVTFARVVVGGDDLLARDLPAPLRLAVAGRLADLGLSDAVTEVLAGSAADAPEGRILRARAAMSAFRPDEVLRLTEGLSMPDAVRLRGAALAMLGDGEAAALALTAAGETDAAADAEWAAGSGDGAPSDGSLAAAFAVALAPPAAAETSGPPTDLAAGRALIDGSAALRERLQALLATVPAGSAP